MQSFSKSYQEAGVDITAGYQAVKMMQKDILRSRRPEVLSEIGGFGGLFRAPFENYHEPILVSGTDGVGTKLKLAFLLNKHDTVGRDCVAMCVNDIVCSAAEPLFFLDYIACGKNLPERIAELVKGVADGCVEAGCALIGGETAEMPGFYPEDEYDLAGFAVGLAERGQIPDGSDMTAGDLLIALPSSGLHSNGFSLVRKIFALDREDKDAVRATLADFADVLGRPLGEELLQPTRIYVKPLLRLFGQLKVKGLAHITGGGFYENIPRCLPPSLGLSPLIRLSDLRTPPVFALLAELGHVPERDLYNTFNMGVGMVLVVAEKDAGQAMASLVASGVEAYVCGELVSKEGGRHGDASELLL